MGKFLTRASETEQLPIKGMYRLCGNELYEDDDGTIYLAWRGFVTDNFTWIKKGDWDIRCAHIHDIGCKYHQVIQLKIKKHQLYLLDLLKTVNGQIICKDIPTKYLEIKEVSGHWINNLFYRMLRDADYPKTPKYIQLLYRCGVACNFGWFKSGKTKIDLNQIYSDKWNR